MNIGRKWFEENDVLKYGWEMFAIDYKYNLDKNGLKLIFATFGLLA